MQRRGEDPEILTSFYFILFTFLGGWRLEVNTYIVLSYLQSYLNHTCSTIIAFLIACIRAVLIVSVVLQLMEASFGWLVVSLYCVECHRGPALKEQSFFPLLVPVLGTNRISFA